MPRIFVFIVPVKFQPTLPARGATVCTELFSLPTMYFNPRSPHGERLEVSCTRPRFDGYFNPRSPHGERQGYGFSNYRNRHISTHAPRTGSDGSIGESIERASISTHAPRTGSDTRTRARICGRSNFNPRSPHGERRNFPMCSRFLPNFNPRSPHGERLAPSVDLLRTCPISTHAPRTGSDAETLKAEYNPIISTHAPRTGSDSMLTDGMPTRVSFQPTLPARGATHVDSLILLRAVLFQPTLPARGATPLPPCTHQFS